MSKKKHTGAVTFYSYPKMIFCWPIIVLGYVMYFFFPSVDKMAFDYGKTVLEASNQTVEKAIDETAKGQPPTQVTAEPSDPPQKTDASKAESPTIPLDTHGLESAGWIYLLICSIVLLTLGIDLERNYAVFWIVFIVGFYFLGMWLQDVKGFTLFGDIYRAFKSLDVRYSSALGLALSILLTPPFIVMLIWVRINHKWRITHNEFEHYAWGRADDSLARGAKRVRSTYPDLLELLLCGAGTLVVYSATGKQELRRIRHVPMLFWVRKRINSLLEVTAVTDTADAVVEEEMEAEEMEEQEGPGPASEESGVEENGEKL